MGSSLNESLGIAGSGTIACGLAAIASRDADIVLWARSEGSATRARTSIEKICSKISDSGADPTRVRIATDLDALAQTSYIVEAVVEDHGSKTSLLAGLAHRAGERTVIATTTSSLSIHELAAATGRPERFAGLHVFNPVPRMELVELVFPHDASEDTRDRSRELCLALGKTPIEVPDIPGFVVNRLLFPYLFNAVELMSQTGLSAEDVDRCMVMGAGLPMGPIALLDFVGLDVSKAIGEMIGLVIPEQLLTLVEEGALGRKVQRGFYDYS
jgi:3-hydroxybutyryl-CoA dehydrogenase